MKDRVPTITKKVSETVIFERNKKMAQKVFSSIASKFEADMKETGLYVPLDYTFRNPDVSCILEKMDSCDKYETIYGLDCSTGVVESEKLPEADAYSKDEKNWVKPVRMIDVIKRFLEFGDLSYVAVLKEVHYNDEPNICTLFVYYFDRNKYDFYLKEMNEVQNN